MGSWSLTENIDMRFIDVREKIKYLKYGYGRATDQLNIAIKLNKISRKEALKIVKKLDGLADPKNEKTICDYLNISREKYDEILSSFVNQIYCKTKKFPKFKGLNFYTKIFELNL